MQIKLRKKLKGLLLYEKMLLLYFLLKPYYIFKSGKIQVSDFFLIGSFFIILFRKKIIISKYNKKSLNIFFVFCLYSIFLNLFYFFKIESVDFLKSITYYIFNFIGIFSLYIVFFNKNFLKILLTIFKVNFIIQFIFLLLNLNKIGSRYKGTFNDPNQFAFYIFITIIYLFIIENILRIEKRSYISYILSLILILFSSSTGMSIGVVLFYLTILIFNAKISKKTIKNILMLFFLGVVLCSFNQKKIMDKCIYLNQRIVEKVNKVDIRKNGNILEVRGIDKLYKNPEYLILGSGEGKLGRFKAFHNLEVHSTLLAIFFYYGLAGFLLIYFWVYRNLFKEKNNKGYLFLAPLIIESFSLAHQRQVLFWGVFVLNSFFKENKIKKGRDMIKKIM